MSQVIFGLTPIIRAKMLVHFEEFQAEFSPFPITMLILPQTGISLLFNFTLRWVQKGEVLCKNQ